MTKIIKVGERNKENLVNSLPGYCSSKGSASLNQISSAFSVFALLAFTSDPAPAEPSNVTFGYVKTVSKALNLTRAS